MVSATPHLLTLPREIRDHIYSYLSHEVTFECGPLSTDGQEDDQDEDDELLQLQLKNAPIVNVLLTHSHLRDEYQQAACFNDIRMIMKTSLVYTINWYYRRRLTKNSRARLEEALKRTRRVSVYTRIESWVTPYIWVYIDSDFSSLLGKYATQVSTVQVVVHDSGSCSLAISPHKAQDNEVAVSHSRGDRFFPAPPRDLLQMPLRQCGQGYRYGYGDSDDVSRTTLDSDGCVVMLENQEVENFHAIMKVGAWLFTSDKPEKHWIKPEEIIEDWPLDTYPDDILEEISQEGAEAVIASRLGLDMEEWKEIRGDAVSA